MTGLYWGMCGVLCAALLLFSDTALSAAQSAVTLWLKSVLPALLPFYVASTLLYSGGLFAYVQKRFPRLMLPICFSIGAISGYPVGARLCVLAGQSDWSRYCNLCSPAFLLGVAAIGMLQDGSYFLPLAIAHYGAALLAAVADCVCSRLRLHAQAVGRSLSLEPIGLPQAITGGMTAMLSVGGCILFFSVCSALIQRIFRLKDGILSVLMAGTMEMTAGSHAASALPLPPRLRCALMAAIVSFGGLSVYMQAQSTAGGIRALSYLGSKAFQGGLAFLIAYVVTPWCVRHSTAVFSADMERLLDNASALSLLLLSFSAAMTCTYLSALVIKAARRHADAGR